MLKISLEIFVNSDNAVLYSSSCAVVNYFLDLSHHIARHWISAPVIRNTFVFNITCYFHFHLIYDHWCHFLLCSDSFITIICIAFLAAILGCFISWVNNIHNKLQIVVICKCKGMLTPLQILTTPWQLLNSSCYRQVCKFC